MAAIHGTNWKEDAIERAEGITDAWEITKVYAGRLAEWVLFVCMIANIIEILPGVEVAGWLANTILGIQAVTLDIAGFGLATMAEQARINRETDAARRAKSTAYLLIGLMMITVLSLSVGTLWHEAKTYTDGADKLLILIRVVMTVVYGHVLHDLRQHSMKVIPMPVIEEQLASLSHRLAEVSHQSSEGLHEMSLSLERVRHQIAHLPVPERVDYVQLAERIVPLLPQPESPNYEAMMTSMLTELSQLQAQKEEAVKEALTALQATVEQMGALHEREDVKGCEEEHVEVSPLSSRPHLKAVKPVLDKQAFIREYLKDHPDASISAIMKAAGEKGMTLSTGYVSQQRKVFQQEAS